MSNATITTSRLQAPRRNLLGGLRRALLGAAVCLLAGSALQPSRADAAGVIDYRIIVRTQVATGGGTDNLVYLKLYGTKGETNEFKLEGPSKEQDKTESVTFQHEDIGVIKKIRIDLGNALSDDWKPHYFRVLRGTSRDDTDYADGWSEFLVDEFVGYDRVSYNATKVVNPAVTVSPSGKPVFHEETLTLVSFGHNPHPSLDQEVMKYTESWSSVETVMVSTGKEQSVGAHINVTWESPETVAGTFGAEAGAEWGKTVSEIREDTLEKTKASEFDWSYTLPADSYGFRKEVFTVPFVDQVYKVSDGSDSRAIRKLNAQIVPVGINQFLFLPKREDSRIVPVSWTTIENEWLVHIARPRMRAEVVRHKSEWLAKGWIYEGATPPAPPAPQPGPSSSTDDDSVLATLADLFSAAEEELPELLEDLGDTYESAMYEVPEEYRTPVVCGVGAIALIFVWRVRRLFKRGKKKGKKKS